MLPNTADRVPCHTSARINQRIRRETEERVARCAEAGQQAIDQRLRELDQEWDVERALEANAATFVLVGVGLGAAVNRRFFALSAIVAGFLLQHAAQGWCPPLPVMRRLGFRTQREIDEERYALKLLRGDFEQLPVVMGADGRAATQALAAARS